MEWLPEGESLTRLGQVLASVGVYVVVVRLRLWRLVSRWFQHG